MTVGALDAPAMELDRIANQTPGNPSFWEAIKAVEFWERQHAALLNQGDPSSAIRRSTALGATVLFGDPSAIGKRPTPPTWCSQKGHEETTCVREPRCIKCFGPHPERYHDAVALEEARRASSQFGVPDRKADPREGDADPKHGRRSYSSRDPAGQGRQPLSPPPPPPPPRAFARAAQDAAAKGGGDRGRPMGPATQAQRFDGDGGRKCFSCGQKGHLKRDCPDPRPGRDGVGRTQAQVNLAMAPYPLTPTLQARDRTLEADREVAERLQELERWRKDLSQGRTRRGDGPIRQASQTGTAPAKRGQEEVFDPFESDK